MTILLTKRLLFARGGDTLFCYLKKTGTLRRCLDFFRAWECLVASRFLAALPILLLGVSEGRAEPFSISQPDKDRARTMSAWGGDSSSAKRRSASQPPAATQDARRFILWFKDRGNSWNPWKKSLLNDPSTLESIWDSGSGKISVPAAVSDAALELQSIPMDDDGSSGSRLWDQSPEDIGLIRSFSHQAGPLAISAPGAADARRSLDSLDFSAPEAVKGSSKVEFSSAESAANRADLSQDPGNLLGADQFVSLPPPGPNPQIASPEPSVTALWGLSALLFACRVLRSKSSSSTSS
jgi:hypothetical protein